MRRHRHRLLALALLLGLPACRQEAEGPPIAEQAEETAVPDRPAPAITDPASPTPVGTDVGTLDRDTAAGRVANDSMAVPRR